MEKRNASKPKQKSVHAGHRSRVKERFLKEGLENFEPHQVLEMLLFYGVPMKDTNEIAHALLDTFGSVYRVMEASYEDLRKVPGVTDHAATLIRFSCQLAKRYWTDRCAMGTIIYSSKDIGDYFKYNYLGETVESVYMLSLDNRAKVLNCSLLARGGVRSADVNFRNVLQIALRDNATQVVLIHNHPNGFAFPSEPDIAVTHDLARYLGAADVFILDHIVISEDDFVSLADTETYSFMFTAKYSDQEKRLKRARKYAASE